MTPRRPTRAPIPAITTINAQERPWTDDIWDRWQEIPIPDDGRIERANYYTPRPYVDEYNRGSEHAGFVYVLRRAGNAGVPEVWRYQWTPGKEA